MKSKIKRSVFLSVLAAVIMTVFIACPACGMSTATASDVSNTDEESKYYTIAVFGLDSRNGNTGKGALSDVNMLVQIDQDNGEIKLVSVYRDTYVQIDKKGNYNKFNQAYHRGGYEQALWAIEHNMDIEPDDFAAFNWKAVVDGINILGGVDLEVTQKEFRDINGLITETVNSTGVASTQLKKPGLQHLDGVQCVAYARLRLMDSDFKRTERQRKIIKLCLEKAQNAEPETLLKLAQEIMPQIETSMELTSLLYLLKNMGNYKIISSEGWPYANECKTIKKKGSCVIPATLESNVIELHHFLYPEDTDYEPGKEITETSKHIEKETSVHEKVSKKTIASISQIAASISETEE